MVNGECCTNLILKSIRGLFSTRCLCNYVVFIEEVKKYAEANGKEPDDLTDEELETIFNGIVDKFLARMMSLLLQTQSVPELVELQKLMATHEDFSETV